MKFIKEATVISGTKKYIYFKDSYDKHVSILKDGSFQLPDVLDNQTKGFEIEASSTAEKLKIYYALTVSCEASLADVYVISLIDAININEPEIYTVSLVDAINLGDSPYVSVQLVDTIDVDHPGILYDMQLIDAINFNEEQQYHNVTLIDRLPF
jgi:hypothetical protein